MKDGRCCISALAAGFVFHCTGGGCHIRADHPESSKTVAWSCAAHCLRNTIDSAACHWARMATCRVRPPKIRDHTPKHSTNSRPPAGAYQPSQAGLQNPRQNPAAPLRSRFVVGVLPCATCEVQHVPKRLAFSSRRKCNIKHFERTSNESVQGPQPS